MAKKKKTIIKRVKRLKNIIHKYNQSLQVIIKITLASVAILAYLLFLFQLIFLKRIYPGVKVVQINLGTLYQIEAEEILKQKTKNNSQLIFNYQDQKWQLPLTAIGFSYDIKQTTQAALNFGRQQNMIQNLKDQFLALRGKTNLSFNYQWGEKTWQEATASLSAQIDVLAIPATIDLTKTKNSAQIEVQTGQPGKKLNLNQLKQTMINHLIYLDTEPINLPVEEVLPAISNQQAEKTKIRAEKLISKTLILVAEDNQWQLGDTELISFLSFTDSYDQEKIASFTAQLALAVDRPPQNALFQFEQGRVTQFKPAKNGLGLDQEPTITLITQGLKNLEEKESKQQTVTLAIQSTKPQVANEDVNDLGIKELVGRGESYFRGSISGRVHNVLLASSKINGLLVAPGETFSLNQALGDVSPQTGYQQAWIIKGGRTVLGDGGGVCQVSTTLFRAILNAGLPVIERQAHAYRVSYYEQNSQLGLDATVFSPSPDLKFQNDTLGHILIQTFVDTKNLYARYYLYGTADGRQVTISPSRAWDQSPPPPALYQDDPTLPEGTVKQIDWAAWGTKVSFDWKVTRADEVLQERTFYSYYKPWQAIYLKGTAGQ